MMRRSGWVQKWIRPAVLAGARMLGSKVVDAESGNVLGKALLLPWRGKIHVIGLETPVRPMFLPQSRLTYWKQALGFTIHPPPDFPRVRPQASGDSPSPVRTSPEGSTMAPGSAGLE